MKNKKKVNRFLAIVLTVLLTLTVLLNAIKDTAIYQRAKLSTYGFLNSMRVTLFEQPISSVASFTDDLVHVWSLREENEQYRKLIDQIAPNQVYQKELERQIKELKDLNNLKTLYAQYRLINGSVVYRDMNSWSNAVTIDVGTKDGLKAGNNYAVITSKGVIGRIVDLGESRSIVSLLTATDSMNQASVRIQVNSTTVVDAILKGYSANTIEFVLNPITDSQSVTIGNPVITSGLGGVYPSGLFLGTVTRVDTSTDANSISIFVSPAADYAQFDYVSVVVVE